VCLWCVCATKPTKQLCSSPAIRGMSMMLRAAMTTRSTRRWMKSRSTMRGKGRWNLSSTWKCELMERGKFLLSSFPFRTHLCPSHTHLSSFPPLVRPLRSSPALGTMSMMVPAAILMITSSPKRRKSTRSARTKCGNRGCLWKLWRMRNWNALHGKRYVSQSCLIFFSASCCPTKHHPRQGS
jgi:hypothetical protein